MTHPLTQLSEKSLAFMVSGRRLIKRVDSVLNQSMVRYQDAIDEIEEITQQEVSETLSFSWGEHKTRLSHWRDSLKIPDLSWLTNDIEQADKELSQACQIILEAWDGIRHFCATLIDKNPIDQYLVRLKERYDSEASFIKAQLLPDLLAQQKRYQLILKGLSDLAIDQFAFCVEKEQLRLFDNTFERIFTDAEQGEDNSIKHIEWVGIDLSHFRGDQLFLEQCSFTRCTLGKTPWVNVCWENVLLTECSGELTFIDSDLRLSFHDTPLLNIQLNRSRCAMTLTDSCVERVFADEHSSISHLSLNNTRSEVIELVCPHTTTISFKASHCDSLVIDRAEGGTCPIHLVFDHAEIKALRMRNFPIASCFINASSLYASLESITAKNIQIKNSHVSCECWTSLFQEFSAAESTVSIMAEESIIKRHTWTSCNAWMISKKGPPIGKSTIIATTGQLETHHLNAELYTVMVFHEDNIEQRSDDRGNGYERIGRIVKALGIQSHDPKTIQTQSLLSFRQSQLLWLLAEKGHVKESYLYEAIAKRPALMMSRKPFPCHTAMLLFFSKKLCAAMSKKPISTCLSLEGLNQADNTFVLDILTLNDSSAAQPELTVGLQSVDLDSHFCRYLLRLLSAYETATESHLSARRLTSTHHELRQLITAHLRKETINAALLARMLQRLVQYPVSTRARSRSCSDYLINYMAQLSTWYLSIRLKSDACASQMSRLLTQEDRAIVSPLLRGASQLLGDQSPLVSCQEVVLQYQGNRAALANKSKLSPLEREYVEMMSTQQWQSLLESDLEREYIRLTLQHIRLILGRYRPFLLCHRVGRQKLNTINRLIQSLNNMQLTPAEKAASVYGAILILLGDQEERDTPRSSQFFRPFAWLALRRSRPTRGYVTTLSLAREILHQLLRENSFHQPSKEACQEARHYFSHTGETVDQIRQLVGFKARNTLKRQLHHLKEGLKAYHADKCLELTIELDSDLSLDEQLQISRSLMEKRETLADWKEQEIKQVMQLWCHYERRENNSLHPITSIVFTNGELSKRHEIISTTASEGSDDQGAHLELMRFSKKQAISPTHEEKMVLRLTPLSKKRRRGRRLFHHEAKEALTTLPDLDEACRWVV